MCSLEFPDLETQIWRRYQSEGVVVLGLSGSGLFGDESASTIDAFIKQTGVTFPILRNDRSYFDYTSEESSISPFPLDVIIDQRGNVAYLRREFDGEAMAEVIERLLRDGP